MTEMDKITLGAGTLDALMPLHMVLDPYGKVLHVGPTLRKVLACQYQTDAHFLDQFEIERPSFDGETPEAAQLVGRKIRLRALGGARTSFKASMYPLVRDQGFLLVLSFGISVVSAVAEFDLTSGDFSGNDPTVEMLYLAEANAAAMAEAQRLIGRLQAARLTAVDASHTDPLTGLRNRRALELEAAQRLRTGRAFSLFQVDLDYFKAVNDTHGHAAGDAVLTAVSRRLMSIVRDGDFVARVGGDEFVVLIDKMSKQDELVALGRRIIAEIERPVPVGDILCEVSASIGIVPSHVKPMPNFDEMLREADAALYTAKGGGRRQAILLEV